MIAVVDYGMGNLRSVAKALERVGADVRVTDDAATVERAAGVVLPGVGAFARCMDNLKGAGLEGAVRAAADSGKPFLGICVGMQILFDESDEFGRVEGLGILPGAVRRFDAAASGGDALKIPHMGWNQVHQQASSPLFDGIRDDERFYFVHSYYVETDRADIVAATADYGVRFVASARRENLMATQFHPEKSQAVGLAVLANFCRLVAGEV